ncbi:hypothetical protein AB205_0054780 [Aquarana catesbeiana]|uniref:Myb/SANT-like DNA-binding domain-containing protein n=1 Tax=Aquarana catesbeiana TaxID=8400 RepID=A0A2G9RI61_AQUCT|nr:hypothetical protein AB205_0054780 [Aquarana catesbeiana]
MDPEDRVWTTAERNTLLNLIQDGGFIPGLTQEFFSNWATFERLSVLLNRCNIRVSKQQVEAQWQLLKEEFWKRKWMVDDGLGQASALTLDFPFYEELEQILISQKPAKVRKREAGSSGFSLNHHAVVGGDEGGGSPEALRPTPCAQAAMDAGPGPMQGSPYQSSSIAKEEQKLAVMKEDLRKKKTLHSKSGNSKREFSKLKSLEEALKKQEKLVASLKESSDVFREKCENEERFQQMKESACASTSQRVDTRATATVWMGGKEVASYGAPSTTHASGSVVSKSVSGPLPPQQPGSSQEEVEENGGLLQTITEMESPLSGTDSSGHG